jgi:hypothetical protein
MPDHELDISAGDHDEYRIMLPCAPEDFAEFVSTLLGKPQTLTGAVFGLFEVSRHREYLSLRADPGSCCDG